MAKKGQKFNSYIFEVKEMVLEEYKEKHNIKYLSEKYNIPLFIWNKRTRKNYKRFFRKFIKKGNRRYRFRRKFRIYTFLL